MIEPVQRTNPVTPVGFHPPYKFDPHYSLPPSPVSPKPLSKPELTPPGKKSAAIASVLPAFVEVLQSVQATYFEMLDTEMRETQTKMNATLQKQIDTQRKLAEENQSGDFWDILRRVAAYFFGAASVVVGALLLGPEVTIMGGIAAGAMILSGATTLTGNVLYDMKKHQEIASALMVIGGAFGIIGGISTTLSGINSLTEILGKVVIASFSVASSSAEAMKAYHQMKMADIKAEHTEMQKARTLAQENYRSMVFNSRDFNDKIASLTENCAHALTYDAMAKKRITAMSGPMAG